MINIYINPLVSKPILSRRSRYIVFHGGRGGGKSWNIARCLIALAHTKPLRIVCAREFQRSIAASVHQLLKDQIRLMGLSEYFTVTKNQIISKCTGSAFSFIGMHTNIESIQSIEGIDIVWVEEAQTVSDDSLMILIPTVRKSGSRVIFSMNPRYTSDAVYQRFVVSKRPDTERVSIGWEDNPQISKELLDEKDILLSSDPELFAWVWGGQCRVIGDAIIFNGKFTIEQFEQPEYVKQVYLGMDFGFSEDPTAVIRNWDTGDTLFIDREYYEWGKDIDELSQELLSFPDIKSETIWADSARPDSISYLKKRGYPIKGAEKGKGSVLDGITGIRSFKKIVLHPRVKNTIKEFQSYSYKIVENELEMRNGVLRPKILPVPMDANNHAIDALRYSREQWMKGKSSNWLNFS